MYVTDLEICNTKTENSSLLQDVLFSKVTTMADCEFNAIISVN